MNKNKNAKLSVDLNWNVPTTGTGTIDISTNPRKVFGLKDDDVKTKPNVVEEDWNKDDAGQTWTVIEVETTETTEAKEATETT